MFNFSPGASRQFFLDDWNKVDRELFQWYAYDIMFDSYVTISHDPKGRIYFPSPGTADNRTVSVGGTQKRIEQTVSFW